MYGWKLIDNSWEPVWFEGKALPDPDDLSDDEIEEHDDVMNENIDADKDDDDDDSSDSSMYLTSDDDRSDDSDYNPYDI